MTFDLNRLKRMQKWIWKRIIDARIRGDKARLNGWARKHKKVVELMDKEIIKELKKIY